MISILEAIILGIVQGITEWLPISSSGHLVLLQNFFNIQPPLIFDIMLHIGSLFVILIVFYKDIKKLILGVLKGDKKQIKLFLLLIVATIPIALIGFFLNDLIKNIFNDLRTVGFSLIITSLLLFSTKIKRKKRKLNIKNTFLIGIAQGLAILPGISRSGATISLGLIQGIEKKEIITLSFLMFIPAILGALLLEINNVSQINNITPLIIGTLTAIVTGFFSLRFLIKIIKKNKFHNFGYYCLGLGIIILSIAYF
jgi:undecaprenyl-diphosphatase